MNYYAGVGSRETPNDILHWMMDYAAQAAKEGWCLRSGGAGGADTAFESGCDRVNGLKQIFLPWPGFNKRPAHKSFNVVLTEEAALIAREHHPMMKPWSKKFMLEQITRGGFTSQAAIAKLMTRNVHQVLGPDCKTPSRFVLCWTPGGQSGGGTGMAIRVAKAHGIPVYDLAKGEVP